MFLDPFSIGFGSVWASQNPPKIEPKSTKNRCQNVFRCWLRFLTVFGRIFVVNPDPRTPKILKKSFVLQYLVEIRFFMLKAVLGTIWASILGPRRSQDSFKTAQDSSKTAQDESKTAPRRPQDGRRGPKTATRRPRTLPRTPQDAQKRKKRRQK